MSSWYSAAQFRNYLDGKFNKHRENIHGYRHTGRTYGKAQEFLSFAESIWGLKQMTPEQREVLPDDITESRLYRIIDNKQTTEVATEALHTRNQSIIDSIVGDQRRGRTDFSHLKALTWLQNFVKSDEQVFGAVVAGLMGAGKTDFAGLLIEIWVASNQHRDVIIATNIPSFGNNPTEFKQEFGAELRFINSIEQVDALLVEGHEARRREEEGGPKAPKYLLLLDEAAQFLDAKTSQKRASTMGKILRLARKAFVNVIVIGQRDIDIAPDVREVCNLFIKKESKKMATLYETVSKNGAFEDPAMKLKHIPPTSIPIRTTDAAFFKFDDDYVFQLDDLIDDEEEQDEEEEQEVVEVVLCQGTKKDGEPCPQPAWKGTGYCYNHQSQRPSDE